MLTIDDVCVFGSATKNDFELVDSGKLILAKSELNVKSILESKALISSFKLESTLESKSIFLATKHVNINSSPLESVLKLNIHEYNEEIDGGEWIKQ
jgi:hypothetical protein